MPRLRLFIRKIDWIALILQHMSFVAWRISRKSIVLVAALTLYMSWFAYFDFLEDIFRSVSSLFICLNSFFFWLFQLLFSRSKKISLHTFIFSLCAKGSLEDLKCNNGILLPKLFWPTVRKNCFRDREKLLKFEAEGREVSKFLRSLEQFIQTVKGQNNFW